MRAVKFGLLAAFFSATAVAQPQTPNAAAPPAAERGAGLVTRQGDFAELSGQGAEMAFVSGRQVRITAQSSDDIFAAGREIRVEGASADHLFAAGGEIDAAPARVRDFIAAGGRVLLRAGVVGDDLVAAGGEISLDRNARIEGSGVLAGGRLRIEAPLGGALAAAGGQIELNGPVAGDVRLRGDEIVVGPQARIGGDLIVRGADIAISPGAVVQGRTVREVVEREDRSAAGFVLFAALFALGVLVMAAAIAAAAPRLMAQVEQRLRSRSWPTIAIGAAIVLLGPILIVALLATVLGAPLGLVLLLAYLLALPLGFAGVAYTAGRWLRRVVRPNAAEPPGWAARAGWTALAALGLTILCMIPIVGGLIWLLIAAAGVGALASRLVDANRRTTVQVA